PQRGIVEGTMHLALLAEEGIARERRRQPLDEQPLHRAVGGGNEVLRAFHLHAKTVGIGEKIQRQAPGRAGGGLRGGEALLERIFGHVSLAFGNRRPSWARATVMAGIPQVNEPEL